MITASLAAIAMATAADIPPDFAERAQAILETSYDADAPGAVAIVVDNGKVVFEQGRGLADVEAGTEIGPDTVFRYASITKQFTAATILQMVAEGEFDLDTPVSAILPEYGGEAGEASVRDLLNHTSGILSYTQIDGFMTPENTAKAMTTNEMIAMIADQPMPAKHGERMAYNNSAYILLGAIIERVTGKNWDTAVRERIAAPLGLASLNGGIYEGGIANMAKGYSRKDDKVVPAQVIHMSLPHAAGALVGTVGDLADWAQALHAGKVVSAPLYAEMIAPTTLADGSTSPFGFGLVNAEVRGAATIGHSGGIFGFSTDSLYIPEEDMFVAVLANSNSPKTDPSVVMRKLAALAIGNPFPDYQAQPLDLDRLERFVGRYQWDVGVRDLFLEDGKLYSRREGSRQMEVQHAGDGVYFYGPDSATFFTLDTGEDGEARMIFHPEGAEQGEPGVRIGEVPSGPENIMLEPEARAALVGTYALPIGSFTVGERDGRMTGKLGPQDAVELEAYAPDHLGAPQFGAEFHFEMEDGKATSMTLKQSGQEFTGARVE